MKIKTLKRLTKLQQEEINGLQELCREVDHTKNYIYLKRDLNFTQEIRCFFLLYVEKGTASPEPAAAFPGSANVSHNYDAPSPSSVIASACQAFPDSANVSNDSDAPSPGSVISSSCQSELLLVSVLTLFVPNSEEAEVTGFTRPEFRGKGYFSMLLKKAAAEAAAFGISRLLYVVEPQCTSTQAIIAAKRSSSEIELEHSEYMMKLTLPVPADPKYETLASDAPVFSLTEALPSDKEAIVPITQTYFGGSYEEEAKWFDNTMGSKGFRMYKFLICSGKASITDGSRIIGSCSVSLSPDNACIYGLGIDSNFRGKGYGKKLLELLLKALEADGHLHLTLEVSSTNTAAFNMYKKAGFEIDAQIDYYAAPL